MMGVAPRLPTREVEPSPVCLDCSQDTDELGEYYMLKDDVWLRAHPLSEGQLCIGCVETRLERQLTPADFTAAPINVDWLPLGWRSARLRSRLGIDRHTNRRSKTQ